MLAVTIGNVHGKYAKPPSLDFPRLKRIYEVITQSSSENIRDTHLVLHGASGLSKLFIQQAIQDGKICKFNVNTDLRSAALDSIRQAFHEERTQNKKVEVLSLMKGSYEAMKVIAKEKIQLFQNSENKKN